MFKKFDNVQMRDNWLDEKYPARKATEMPGMYTVPNTSLVISVRLMTVEVIDTAHLPSWQDEPDS